MVENPASERTIITVVRAPGSYTPGGFAAVIPGLNQIAKELSGEHKIAVFANGSGFVANVVSIASGNVATVTMVSLTSGVTSASGAGAEVANAVNLSGVKVTLIATGY